MKKHMLLMAAAAGLLWIIMSVPVRQAHAQGNAFVRPTVFQAAGPTVSSIQSSVDEFRAALAARGESLASHRDGEAPRWQGATTENIGNI